MKKQILAAAVAATFAVPAMATISITGDANFEYTHTDTDTGGTSSTVNGTDTELNLKVVGKAGDTKVVMDFEIDDHGGADTALDIENTYITTKLGPVSAKLGNYTLPTTAILGEIENGGRASDKMTFSYTTNGIKFYAGNSGTTGDDTTINNNAFAGVVANFSGWKVQLKKHNENKNSFGVQGTAGPVGVRFEMADSDSIGTDANTKDKDSGMFLGLTAKFSNIDLGLHMIDMDGDGGITEDDSSIFAISNAGAGNSNTQLSASMKHDGTTYGLKFGQIGYETSGMEDWDYIELSASRMLASGAKLGVSYLDESNADGTNNKDRATFEIDLSVKF